MAYPISFLLYVLVLILCNATTVQSASIGNNGNLDPVIGAATPLTPQGNTRPQHHYSQLHQQLAPPQSQPQQQQQPEQIQASSLPLSEPEPSIVQSLSPIPVPSSSGEVPQGSGEENSKNNTTEGEKAIPLLDGMAGLAPDYANFMHGGVDFQSAILQQLFTGGVNMLSEGGKLASLGNIFAGRKLDNDDTAANVTELHTDAKGNNRRRGRNVEFDTDLTELAEMVLSAIQSEQCMQRSICLLGSRIGGSDKGTLGFLLMDKLIPESVQGSAYFVTLKKALRGGENYCDKFRCRIS